MFCSYCGKKIRDEAIFCPQCGKKLPKNTSSERAHIINDWEFKDEDFKTVEDEAFIFNQSKNEQNKKLKFMDYISLYFLSLRGFFWRIDGRDYRYYAKLMFPFGWILRLIVWLMMIWPFIFAIDLVVVAADFLSHLMIGLAFSIIFWFVIFIFGLIFIDFNMHRLFYNIRFKKSAWWKNTGIGPNEIRKDKSKGLYGEYMVTMAVEQNMKKYHLAGEIFNRVIVPKKDGDFTEVDVVSVSEAGIMVFEAKAKSGVFRGYATEKMWTQTLGKQQYKEENPLFQNWQHCNFLNEYISECLPEGDLKRHGLFDKIIPVTLFTMSDASINISGTTEDLACYCSHAIGGKNSFMGLNTKKIFGVNLSVEDQKSICCIIDKIAHIPQEEQEAMKTRRHLAETRGDLMHRYKYFVAQVWEPEGSVSYYACCRTDGYYTMIEHPTGLFFSHPEICILYSGKKYDNFNQANNEKQLLYENPDDEVFHSVFNDL